MKESTIGVLGVGSMGQRIVEDLKIHFKGNIVVLGRDTEKIKKTLRLRTSSKGKIRIRSADVTQSVILVKAFEGIDVLIHAVHHEYNLNVMEACLKSKTHYIDLGGLYHYTKKQLRLSRRFQKAGLIAVLGMGAAPGITNVLAVQGASEMDRVDTVDIRIGGIDQSIYRHPSPLSNSYSLQTLLEECSWKPAVFKNRRMYFVKPFSGREPYLFPEPVGQQKPQYTIHSELATLSQHLKANNVSFKIAFDDAFVEKMHCLESLNFLSEKNKSKTVAILQRLPRPIPKHLKQYEIIQVKVIGNKKAKKHEVIMEAHISTVGETIDKDTAAPASIVAQWIANSQLTQAGVFAPERVIDPKAFFQELFKRNIFIHRNGKRFL